MQLSLPSKTKDNQHRYFSRSSWRLCIPWNSVAPPGDGPCFFTFCLNPEPTTPALCSYFSLFEATYIFPP